MCTCPKAGWLVLPIIYDVYVIYNVVSSEKGTRSYNSNVLSNSTFDVYHCIAPCEVYSVLLFVFCCVSCIFCDFFCCVLRFGVLLCFLCYKEHTKTHDTQETLQNWSREHYKMKETLKHRGCRHNREHTYVCSKTKQAQEYSKNTHKTRNTAKHKQQKSTAKTRNTENTTKVQKAQRNKHNKHSKTQGTEQNTRNTENTVKLL